ncbi:hypothetical protein EBR43_01680 [bacterium]|nr:hypothetical protein [bacterium]NBX71686.1 hypothetical protein [bacterium]
MRLINQKMPYTLKYNPGQSFHLLSENCIYPIQEDGNLYAKIIKNTSTLSEGRFTYLAYRQIMAYSLLGQLEGWSYNPSTKKYCLIIKDSLPHQANIDQLQSFTQSTYSSKNKLLSYELESLHKKTSLIYGNADSFSTMFVWDQPHPLGQLSDDDIQCLQNYCQDDIWDSIFNLELKDKIRRADVKWQDFSFDEMIELKKIIQKNGDGNRLLPKILERKLYFTDYSYSRAVGASDHSLSNAKHNAVGTVINYYGGSMLKKLLTRLNSFVQTTVEPLIKHAYGMIDLIQEHINIMQLLGSVGFHGQSYLYNEFQKAFKAEDNGNQHKVDYKIIILGSLCTLIGLALVSGLSWKIFVNPLFLQDLNQRLNDIYDGLFAIKTLSKLCYYSICIGGPVYFTYQRISSFLSLNTNLIKTALSSIEELFDSYLTPQSFMHHKIEFFAGKQLDLSIINHDDETDLSHEDGKEALRQTHQPEEDISLFGNTRTGDFDLNEALKAF